PAFGHAMLGRLTDRGGAEGRGVHLGWGRPDLDTFRLTGEQPDDLVPDDGQLGPELLQDLGGHALALADQPEQDVLGPDVVVPELKRFAQRELQDLLRPRGEGDVAGGGCLPLADDLLDLGPNRLQRDSQRLEGFGGDALAL